MDINLSVYESIAITEFVRYITKIVVYVDMVNGDDDTGDGSAGNPYKTITTASTGLTGGDEVRIAKSPDDVTLTGTVSFEKDMESIVGDGTSFTTELAVGDYIEAPNGCYYEIDSITDDESATFLSAWTEENVSGVTIKSVGYITIDDVQQDVVGEGVDPDYLLISGGWDLTTETQTGRTNCKSSGSPSGETALYMNDIEWCFIEKLSFMRFSTGIGADGSSDYVKFRDIILNYNSSVGLDIGNGLSYWDVDNLQTNWCGVGISGANLQNCLLKNIFAIGNGSGGIDVSTSSYIEIDTFDVSYNSGGNGITFDEAENIIVRNMRSWSNFGYAISGTPVNYLLLENVDVSSCDADGIDLSDESRNCIIRHIVSNSNNGRGIVLNLVGGEVEDIEVIGNSDVGLELNLASFTKFANIVATGNGDSIYINCDDYISYGCVMCDVVADGDISFAGAGGIQPVFLPAFSMQNVQFYVGMDAFTGKLWWDESWTRRDSVMARGGSGSSLRFDYSSGAPFGEELVIKAISDVDLELKFWTRKQDNDETAKFECAVFFQERNLTGWVDILPTASAEWQERTLTIDKSLIDVNGAVILRLKASQSGNGSVWFDDLAVSYKG